MSSPPGISVNFEQIGEYGPLLFWGHGWGQNLSNFKPLAMSLERFAQHWLIDFPGFGKSPLPSSPWGTEEYADHIAAFIRAKTAGKIIWVGHSFGCRVGIQLAAKYPELIDKMILIAAAGLPRVQNPVKKLYFKLRIRLYKFLKKLIPFGLPEQWLLKTFASPDYLNAGALRTILVKTVNEDLSRIAQTVSCPVMLLYGSEDTETPVEMGKRYHSLIPRSELIVLDGFDHYSILSDARHLVAQRIKHFIEGTKDSP